MSHHSIQMGSGKIPSGQRQPYASYLEMTACFRVILMTVALTLPGWLAPPGSIVVAEDPGNAEDVLRNRRWVRGSRDLSGSS